MDKEQKITLYEGDFYEKEKLIEKSIQFIPFRISSEWYGVEIAKAKEVISVNKITRLPFSPPHIAGIVNIRGGILSVTNLNIFFGLPKSELSKDSKLLVIALGNLETGLLVDEVFEPIDITSSSIDPTLTTIAPEKASFIEGHFKINDKLVGILNIEKILKIKKGAAK